MITPMTTPKAPLVHLQGIGNRPGIAAGQLTPGQTLVWNYGYTSEVVSITPSATGKTVILVIRDTKTGIEYTRRMGANRLVAVPVTR